MKRQKRILSLLVLLAVLTMIPAMQSLAASVPGQVKSVKAQVVNMSDNTTTTLSWKQVKNATGYYIYRVNGTKLKKVATTKSTTCTIKNLTPGTKYQFQVFAYNSEGKGKGSSLISVKTTNWLSTVHQRYFVTTVTSTTKATVVSTGKSIKIAKDTKIVAHTRTTAKKTIKATMADGTVILISNTKLRYGNVKTTSEYYSQSVKENFVNKKGYSSTTDYLIWINQYTCNTTIFKGSEGNWKQVRSMPCIIGNGGRTTTGTYKLLRQETAYGKPKIYFSWNPAKGWGNSFHCRLGSDTRGAVSHGCVRLGDADLYYLAATCPIGTTVISY
jgi:hypothetical protein